MSNLILIPGMWLGGWAWDAVATLLRKAGHDVTAVTLSREGATLESHIAEVQAAIGDASDVVLVGHSYGGLPARGAVSAQVSRVVYVDSGPLPDGVSQADVSPPAPESFETGWIEPPSFDPADDPVQFAGLDKMAEWIRSRALPQPLATATAPLKLMSPEQPPTDLVCSTFPAEVVQQMIDSDHPFFAGLDRRDYSVHELPTGHWPMFSRPVELATLLDKIVS